MNRIGRILVLALAFGLHVTACGSDARATDACRQIENARCERGAACGIEGFGGDVGSCQRFYNVQCGRGIPEAAKEPSKRELSDCVNTIKSDCEAVKDPGKYCPFLVANEPAVTDSGSLVPDMGTSSDAADASDAGDDGG